MCRRGAFLRIYGQAFTLLLVHLVDTKRASKIGDVSLFLERTLFISGEPYYSDASSLPKLNKEKFMTAKRAFYGKCLSRLSELAFLFDVNSQEPFHNIRYLAVYPCLLLHSMPFYPVLFLPLPLLSCAVVVGKL